MIDIFFCLANKEAQQQWFVLDCVLEQIFFKNDLKQNSTRILDTFDGFQCQDFGGC